MSNRTTIIMIVIGWVWLSVLSSAITAVRDREGHSPCDNDYPYQYILYSTLFCRLD